MGKQNQQIKQRLDKSHGFCQVDTQVSAPIDVYGKELRWHTEQPDKSGWWWLKYEETGETEIVYVFESTNAKLWFLSIDNNKQQIKVLITNNDLLKRIPYQWAGPICLPID